MADRILRLHQVRDLANLSANTIRRLEEGNEFPKRIALSARAVGWHEAEIEAWLASRLSSETKYPQSCLREAGPRAI